MDKYEYQLKLDQLKNLINEGDYTTAGEIVDSINWKKVRNSATLCMAADVYDKLGRYEESKDVYLMAYDHAPIGRNIVYKLTEVAIKSKSVAEAEEYYNEYAEIANNDTQKMMLRYKLSTLKGEPVQNRISILEELKERDYSEEWAYELALLYHHAGRAQDCVDVCDELDLWFGEGEYVQKALELKKQYAPLTKLQEDKLVLFQYTQPEVFVTPEIETPVVETPEVELYQPAKDMIPEETIDLQAALTSGLRDILDQKSEFPSKSEEVFAKEAISQEAPAEECLMEETPEEVPVVEMPVVEMPVVEVPVLEAPVLEMPVEELPAEATEEFVEPNLEEEAWLNDQITGQINIEDVLAEWEKTKTATEAVLAEAEAEVVADKEPEEEAPVVENPMDQEPEEVSGESLTDADIDAMLVMPDISNLFANEPVVEETSSAPLTDDDDIDAQFVMPDITGMIGEEKEEPVIETTPEPEIPMPVWEAPQVVLPNLVMDPEALFAESTAKTVDEIPLPNDFMEDITNNEVVTGEVVLTKEQRALFPYFLPVPGMEPQICQVLKDCLTKKKSITSLTGNITIEGPDGSGKTVLAASLVKALQMMSKDAEGKIGKISAVALNKKDFASLLPRLEGGYLIIEKAGNLQAQTIEKISRAMEGNTQGLTVIMEDSKSRIRAVMAQNRGFAQKFTSNITIPVFTIDELVEFGKSYAKEMECIIDEMGILALYNRISNIQKLDKATTLTEVREIVDQAIENAEGGGGLKKTFGSFLSKRYNENDFLILHEKDFDF